MRNQASKCEGFTLLEILIVISIIGTLSIVGVTSYSGFNQSKALEIESQEFVQILDLAKKRAFSNDKAGCGSLDHYSITIDTENSVDYDLTAVCEGGSINQTLSYHLDSAVIFQQYQSAESRFNPNSSGATSNCIIVKHSKLNQCQQVSVNSLGLIEIEDSEDCQC